MKIYIAGKITGNPDYREQFKAAEDRLTEQGYIVVNPVMSEGFTYDQYIIIGLPKLSMCDAIYLLENWQDSEGAKLEKHYAEVLGKDILYENDIQASADGSNKTAARRR